MILLIPSPKLLCDCCLGKDENKSTEVELVLLAIDIRQARYTVEANISIVNDVLGRLEI